MKKINLTILVLLCLVQAAWADDTDIYGVSTINIKPNVLIIFDNSGSMGTKDVPGEVYAASKDYTYTGGRSRYEVFVKTTTWSWHWSSSNYDTSYFSDVNDANWQCAAAKTDLLSKGYWGGYVQKNNLTGVYTCGGSTYRDLRLGNFQNFDDQNLGDTKTRIEVAKKVMAQLIYENYNDVRFGLMKFNSQTPYNYYGSSDDKKHESGYIMAGCGASKSDLIGSYDPATTVFTDSNQSTDYGAIGGMYSDTYTPLAETMAEAGRYFAGVDSWYNGGSTGTGYPYGKFSESCAKSDSSCRDYSGDSPIQYRCQKNYIIFMTDGEPTRDNNGKLKYNYYINGIKIPAAGKDGASDYLDDVAYFLAHNDLQKASANPTSAEFLKKGIPGDFEDQTVTTYTIGFKQNLALLQNAATNGGGKYYTADDTSTLNEALSNILVAILSDVQSFSAAAVPVSRANKAYSGNYVYYGLFQPVNIGNWVGNLKKYGISDLGVITDKNGLAVANNGTIVSNSQSYWSSSEDGADIRKGGAAAKLLADLEAGFVRKIYTYTGTNPDLTHSTNSFSPGNSELLAFNANLTDPVIGDIRHDNDNEWPLGSLLHSEPLVVHYDDNDDGKDDYSVVYVGGNDGMLHAFSDTDGSEKWGFIPQDLLFNIHTLPVSTGLQYYVDGTPTVYTYDHDNNQNTKDKKMLLIGEHRGGDAYTAIDISDHNKPLFQYQIQSNILGGGNIILGQSWGKPRNAKILDATSPTPQLIDAFIMAGGYDTNQDLDTPLANDSKGRAIYAVDSKLGNLQANLNFNIDNFSIMTHSIVSVAAFENPKSRTTTRIYAGDMNGNMLAFRDDIFHRNQDKTQAASFGGFYDGQEDGVWGQKLRLFSSPGKKIFYSPNIVSVLYPVSFTYPMGELDPSVPITKTSTRAGDYVFYGTGDREHPENISTVNEFYAIKNNWQWGSETPTIIKAYVDKDDNGRVKARADDSVIVDRDTNGKLIEVANPVLYILDITDDLYQNQEADNTTKKLYKSYIEGAIDYSSNKGWYLQLVNPTDDVLKGEKVVSSPIIFGGSIYFTTYEPEDTSGVSNDPCANPGARGTGWLYQIGVRYGESIEPAYNNDGPSDKPVRLDRRITVPGKGIPPEPVLVIHEGKPSVIVGFQSYDTNRRDDVEEFFWRQL